jgi:CBS domain-containing protein
MLEQGLFEKSIQRIGAEQELFLIDKYFRPAPRVIEVLEKINDEHFVTEYAKFNIEFNLEPLLFKGRCFSRMEENINRLITKLKHTASELGLNTAMAGILPTIRQSDLTCDNITPFPRYYALNKALSDSRDGSFEYRIKGIDELLVKLDSSVFDFCNTAFQVHLQVSPDEFTNMYNCAQLIAAPVLAAATNSPLLLGKRLWKETRIELAEQAIDTRTRTSVLNNENPRVAFEDGWLEGSILDIFMEDISRYRSLLTSESTENSLEILMKGNIPAFNALRTFNGTIYKWNRACYGVYNGIPHLRIENRILPAGPTVTDEVANAAFWLGLMNGLPAAYGEISKVMDFDEVSYNFLKAAQVGLEAQFTWKDNARLSAEELINDELVPIAREGLKKAGVNEADIEKYTGIIEERVASGMTGSQWLLNSYSLLKKGNEKNDSLVTLTSAMVKRQESGEPVHTWTPAGEKDIEHEIKEYLYLDQIMAANFISVHENDIYEFAKCIMEWNELDVLAVEDSAGMFAGCILKNDAAPADSEKLVKDYLTKEVITASRDMLIKDAETLLNSTEAEVIFVTEEERLIGIVTCPDIEGVLKGNKINSEYLKPA